MFCSYHKIDIYCIIADLTHWPLGNFNEILDVIFKQILVFNGWGISCEIALIWMSLDFVDDQSTLVQVMAWCHQATSHYLNQYWPRSLSPYGVTRPQRVNSLRPSDASWRQAIIWTNAGILLIGPWRKNFSEIFDDIYIFSFIGPSRQNPPREPCLSALVFETVTTFLDSLWPSDIIIWINRSGSILAQTMACCCLIAPSQYLNQCCIFISNSVRGYRRECSRQSVKIICTHT